MGCKMKIQSILSFFYIFPNFQLVRLIRNHHIIIPTHSSATRFLKPNPFLLKLTWNDRIFFYTNFIILQKLTLCCIAWSRNNICQKFLKAQRLWVGRWCVPVLRCISKIAVKIEFMQRRVIWNVKSYLILLAYIEMHILMQYIMNTQRNLLVDIAPTRNSDWMYQNTGKSNWIH